jgi:acyl-homoserine-lactone acylase
MALGLALALSLTAAPNVEIFRDSWGVPSIVSQDLEGVYYGLGYMHVTDNAERMALNYKIARGRAAEVLGRGQLLQDGFVRGLELEERAEAAKLSPVGEMIVRSYLEGANRALTEKRASVAQWVQPFTRTDVLSMGQFINCAFPLLDLASALMPGTGSNQFAVGPARSATRSPIVSMDPHLEWNGADGGIVWYEVGLYGPALNFRGVTVPGLPAGAMGHNDKVAWSFTNNNPALAVRYTVVTDPNNRNRYNYHGEWKEFRTKQIKMAYREGADLKEQNQTLRLTEWGPMVPLRSEAAFIEPLGVMTGLEQFLGMMRARSGSELRSAFATRGLSMWNFVYGDVSGNIGYQYNAYLRKRDPGFDWRGVVPGNDPKTRLGELLRLNELPNVVNPASQLLVNCNSAPWLTPLGGEIPSQWPAYVTTYGGTTRFDLLSSLLKADASVDLDEARLIATDTHLPFWGPTVRALASAGAAGDGMEQLRRWDGRSDIDSVGAALFVYWASQNPSLAGLAQKASRGVAWSAEENSLAASALAAAEKALVRDFGKLNVRWGELLRMRRGGREIGVSGYGNIVPGLGAAVNPTGASRRGPLAGEIVANRGSSWRMVVSLEPGQVRSWSVVPYGNSHDAASPFYNNQMSLFAARRYKETVFGAGAARQRAVSRIELAR